MTLDPALIVKLLERPEQTRELPSNLLADQTILVTGAGGSIGSALCRTLATMKCRSVIALDNHELALLTLQGRYELELLDLRSETAVAALLRRRKPDVIVHTAAYKHLPLLQRFPFVAFENNTLVTARLARLSRELGVPRFLFLSSDKASDPVSVLGISKRIAEMSLVGSREAALRCANVLGSSGSVLSVWAGQVAQGEALTVVPEAERLFISSEEAVSALLALADARHLHGLFAPAAASPVRIEDLADRFLGPQRPNWPRHALTINPAEKEREALCSGTESLQPTSSKHLLRIEERKTNLLNLSAIIDEIARACETRNLPLLFDTAHRALHP